MPKAKYDRVRHQSPAMRAHIRTMAMQHFRAPKKADQPVASCSWWLNPETFYTEAKTQGPRMARVPTNYTIRMPE